MMNGVLHKMCQIKKLYGEFDILRLTNQELWLELDTNRIELEKIN